MYRWLSLMAVLAAAISLSCGGGGSNDASSIADRVLRIGEGVGTEVQIFEGEQPDALRRTLNPDDSSDEEEVSLPPLPDSTLLGSARVTRSDGLQTYFVMYEVSQGETAVAEAARGLFDESPWQVVGGQSSEGVSAYRFQSTRSGSLVGTVVVQPLPTTDTFDVVVSRNGDEETLNVERHAFIPVLGAELQERDGEVVVSKLGAGSGASAGLEEDDRLVRIGDEEIEGLDSVGAALRGLGDGNDPVSSVIYILQASPLDSIISPFVLPDARPIPGNFPAPFLVRDGSIPVAVEWAIEPAGAAYQILFLTEETLVDVVDGYRDILNGQGLNITSDQAQGTATTLEFASADNQMIGAISIDSFSQDDRYTEATVQVQAASGFTLGPPPAPTPTPAAGTATPGADPGGSPSPAATP